LFHHQPGGGARRADFEYDHNTAFKDHDIKWEIKVTHEAGDAKKHASEAAQDGYDIVAVYGGDGSVMEAASGLLDTQIPLAIIPGGTANVMSNELGIPQNSMDALQLLANGDYTPQAVDMGLCNENQLFILRFALGVEAAMVENADRDLKTRFGVLAYAVSAISSLGEAVPSTYSITIDGETVHETGISCAVANSANVGRPGLYWAPGCSVTDGLLDVIVFRRKDPGALMGTAAAVLSGTHNEAVMGHYQGKEITITADPPQVMQVDGELLDAKNVKIKVLPQAVRIIVPKPATPEANPS
jgi:YegS/Rv2252/BmrU family lipid kinase